MLAALSISACTPHHHGASEQLYTDKMTGETVYQTGDAVLLEYMRYPFYVGLTSTDGNPAMRIGYQGSTWLFISECWVKIGDDVHQFKNLNPARTVLSNGGIIERTIFPVDLKLVESLAAADPSTVVFRVSGSRGYEEWESTVEVSAKAKAMLTHIKY